MLQITNKSTLETVIFRGGSSLTFVLPPYPYILDNITKLHLNESIFRIFLPFPS